MTYCTYPTGQGLTRCNRPAVVRFGTYFRCKRHDSKGARATAERMGLRRVELAPDHLAIAPEPLVEQPIE